MKIIFLHALDGAFLWRYDKIVLKQLNIEFEEAIPMNPKKGRGKRFMDANRLRGHEAFGTPAVTLSASPTPRRYGKPTQPPRKGSAFKESFRPPRRSVMGERIMDGFLDGQ